MDRIKPLPFGIPSPIDDVYDQSANDEISVNFNELIACVNGTAQIIDLVTNDILTASVNCFDNKVIVLPQFSLGQRDSSVYRVILSDITDEYGNVADVYKWVFIVGDYNFEEAICLPDLQISNNNENKDAISVSNYRDFYYL